MYNESKFDRAPQAAVSADSALTIGFINRVYLWMASGLAVSGLCAFWVSGSPETCKYLFSSGAWMGLLIAEIILVMVLSVGINKLSALAAGVCFMVYALLNGATLAPVFMVYTASSIASAFFITAGTFAVMSVYGYTTRRDLTTVGNFLLMALIGAVIAMVVNMFVRSSGLALVIDLICVIVFVGLMAYDTQKIKNLAVAVDGGHIDESVGKKYAVIGALSLYLDFVNFFLIMLRLFGGRRN